MTNATLDEARKGYSSVAAGDANGAMAASADDRGHAYFTGPKSSGLAATKDSHIDLEPASQLSRESVRRVAAFYRLHQDVLYAFRTESARAFPDFTPRNEALYEPLKKLFEEVGLPGRPDAEVAAIFKIVTPEQRKEVCNWVAKAERAAAFDAAENLQTLNLENFNPMGFGRSFDQQADNEIAAFPLRHLPWKDKHRILSLGGGPFPLGPIAMYQKIGKNITGLDKNRRVVDVANWRLAKQGVPYQAIHYKHASMDMYASEHHPLACFNNAVLNDTQMFDNVVQGRWSETVICRVARGMYAMVYHSFSPDTARELGLYAKALAPCTPSTMQTSVLATIIVSPEQEAKRRAQMSGPEGYCFTLDADQKNQLSASNPNSYLMIGRTGLYGGPKF